MSTQGQLYHSPRKPKHRNSGHSRQIRVASIFFSKLPLECVFQDSPEWGNIPCAIRNTDNNRHTLTSICPLGIQLGLRVGMTETEAKAKVADLCVKDREPSIELARLEQLAELLFSYSSDVEVRPPCFLLVEISRSQNIWQKDIDLSVAKNPQEALCHHIQKTFSDMGHQLTIAIADDTDTAHTCVLASQKMNKSVIAKRSSKKDTNNDTPATEHKFFIVAPGQTQRVLSNFPIEYLSWTEQRKDPNHQQRAKLQGICERLKILGIKKVEQLRQIAPDELAARFGEEGSLLSRRARGLNQQPIKSFLPAQELEESYEFDGSVEAIETILFVLRNLFSRLEKRLQVRHQALKILKISCLLDTSKEEEKHAQFTIHLALASRKTETLLNIVKERLNHSLPHPVIALRITAEETEKDAGSQLDLFSKKVETADTMGELISRLTAAYGEQSVFKAQLVNTHRPEEAWKRTAFSIKDALAPSKNNKNAKNKKELYESTLMSKAEQNTLPSIQANLKVVTPEIEQPMQLSFGQQTWPKPMRNKEQKPPNNHLPPRPIQLLKTPEPAFFPIEGDGFLVWRGKRLPIKNIGYRELFNTQWWTEKPLDRDYRIIETTDGHRFWVFRDKQNTGYVHGIFD